MDPEFPFTDWSIRDYVLADLRSIVRTLDLLQLVYDGTAEAASDQPVRPMVLPRLELAIATICEVMIACGVDQKEAQRIKNDLDRERRLIAALDDQETT
jgi:hypothetical protein